MMSDDVTEVASPPPPVVSSPEPAADADDGEIARITLRLPEHLKAQIEHAATTDRLSVNAWLVRALARTLDTRSPDSRPQPMTAVDGQRLTGWAR